MSDFSPKMAKKVSQLGRLHEEINDLQEQLKAKKTKVATLEGHIISKVVQGTYQVGRWVLDITETTVTSRKSTAWKNVSEAVEGGISVVRDKLTDKYPDSERVIRNMARRLLKVYNEAYDEHTKEPTKSKKKEISVTRLDN